MLRNSRSLRYLFLLLFFALSGNPFFTVAAAAHAAFDPPAVYAMWQTDPTTSISILWHTRNDDAQEATQPPEMEIRAKNAWRRARWQKARAASTLMPHSNRTIHRATVVGLRPGTEYSFRFNAASRVYSFRTMPAKLNRPVRFATGGDTMHSRAMFEKTNLEAMKHDLDFVMFGGDLAYANDDPKEVQRWYDWFDVCKKTLITPKGRVVPIVVTIGNHEVQGAYNQTPEQAQYYFTVFPFPGVPGYDVLDFGNYLSLVLLDTSHVSPIRGAQTEWLAKTLAARRNVPHVFPLYHVPIYPSVRNFNEESAQRVNWAPLFEQHGVHIVFENHDHAYKRTHPIRAGKIDHENGVVYLGDGCWGVNTREVQLDRWYLAKAVASRHFILGTLRGKKREFQMIDDEGKLIDSFPAVRRQ